jgi:hypothetical protein
LRHVEDFCRDEHRQSVFNPDALAVSAALLFCKHGATSWHCHRLSPWQRNFRRPLRYLSNGFDRPVRYGLVGLPECRRVTVVIFLHTYSPRERRRGMDEARAKAVLRDAFLHLRDGLWAQAGLAGLSERSRDIIYRTLERLRDEIEADPAWMDDVLSEVGLRPRLPQA